MGEKCKAVVRNLILYCTANQKCGKISNIALEILKIRDYKRGLYGLQKGVL